MIYKAKFTKTNVFDDTNFCIEIEAQSYMEAYYLAQDLFDFYPRSICDCFSVEEVDV